jgi:hypothetical protein
LEATVGGEKGSSKEQDAVDLLGLYVQGVGVPTRTTSSSFEQELASLEEIWAAKPSTEFFDIARGTSPSDNDQDHGHHFELILAAAGSTEFFQMDQGDEEHDSSELDDMFSFQIVRNPIEPRIPNPTHDFKTTHPSGAQDPFGFVAQLMAIA